MVTVTTSDRGDSSPLTSSRLSGLHHSTDEPSMGRDRGWVIKVGGRSSKQGVGYRGKGWGHQGRGWTIKVEEVIEVGGGASR